MHSAIRYREYERMSRFTSYPYNHGGEDELVNDAITNEDESEANDYRVYRMRMREQMKDGKYRY